jgi:V/A-type H+-transporting ATPase subunit I
MKRIEIAALTRDRKQIAELLQRRGIVEISENETDELSKFNTAESVSQFEKVINAAIQAKGILSEYAPQKKSMISSMLLTPVDKSSFEKYTAQRDKILSLCYELIGLQKSATELKADIARTQAQIDSLKIWLSLDVSMQFRGTEFSKLFIGTMPNQLTEADILTKIASLNPALEMFNVEIVSSFKEITCIAVVSHADIADELLSSLREIGFVSPNDPARIEPRLRMNQLEEELKSARAKIDESISKIKSYSGSAAEIEFLIDYYSMRRDKYMEYQKIGYTKNTFVITGYVPEKYSQVLLKELEESFAVTVNITEPEEDEDVPILLQNSGFASPVEPITEMFATPSKNDLDPNAIMAFFYYLFFGIMLSDAGYGLLMVIFTGYVLSKKNLKEGTRKSMKMFFFCGISTLFWGAMFGSWFGDIVQVVSKQFFEIELGSIALWFEPIRDPMTFLLYSLGFGTIHLFFGLGIKFVQLWSSGQKLDAILDVIPIYIFVIGAAPLGVQILAPVPESFLQIGQYMALVGTVLIIFTSSRSSKNPIALFFGGLYGMYGVASGYLSDILSYSRLLALGLATGSIATVVNLMGTLSENKIMKAIVLIVVFVFGHALNMAINLLGAYVHTNRLQFVEFFSRFYEGGGRAFAPLKVNTKYIHLKEEIQNG